MRVPVAQRQIAATPLRGGRQQLAVSAETFGAGQGQTLEQGGRDLQTFGDDLAAAAIDAQRRQNETEVRQAVADWQKQTTPVLSTYQSQQGRNAVDGYSGLPGQLDTITAQVRGQLSGDAARELFDQSIVPRRTALDATTARHYHRQLQVYEVGALGAQMEAAAEQGVAVPETIDRQVLEIRAAAMELQSLTGESDEEREGRILTAVTGMHSGVVDRLLADGNVTVAASHFDQHREAMLPSEQARIGRRIETARKQGMALAQAQLRTGIQDEIASLRRTGHRAGVVTNDQIRAAYGEQAGEIIAGLDREAAFFEVRQEVATNTPAEDAALLESLRPEGENFAEEAERYDLILKAAQDKAGALAADPAAYVLSTNPQLQSAYQAAQQDPSLLHQAVSLSLREQERLGVPSWQTRALPKGAATAVAAEFASIADPTQQANRVADLAALYGPSWPRVQGEMVQAGLPSVTGVIAQMSSPLQTRARTHLAEASRVGLKTLKGNIGNENSQFISDTVLAELQPLRESLRFNVGGATVYQQQHDAVLLLAHAYASAGDDRIQAAKKASADIINNQYVFQDTYRVPVGVDPERVAATVLRVTLSLDGQEALPLGAPEMLSALFPNMEPEEVQRQYARALQDSGTWVTNEMETGLIIVDQNGIPAMRPDGTPLEIAFDRLDLLTEGYNPIELSQ